MFDDGRQHASMLEIGTGRFVMPRPNRLVILAGGVSHMIAPVSPAAGHHVRGSIAGFFVTPAGVVQLARHWLT
jgi:Rps23 Pro-64 3,4-dihydroxylase Tpa1-like proline 4-hydroxylase